MTVKHFETPQNIGRNILKYLKTISKYSETIQRIEISIQSPIHFDFLEYKNISIVLIHSKQHFERERERSENHPSLS